MRFDHIGQLNIDKPNIVNPAGTHLTFSNMTNPAYGVVRGPYTSFSSLTMAKGSHAERTDGGGIADGEYVYETGGWKPIGDVNTYWMYSATPSSSTAAGTGGQSTLDASNFYLWPTNSTVNRIKMGVPNGSGGWVEPYVLPGTIAVPAVLGQAATVQNSSQGTVNTLFSAGYSNANPSNRQINVQQILNSTTANQVILLSGTLGSTSAVGALTCTSLLVPCFGIVSDDSNLYYFTAAAGSNTTPTLTAFSSFLTTPAAASSYVPQSTTVNGNALSGNVTVSASDITRCRAAPRSSI